MLKSLFLLLAGSASAAPLTSFAKATCYDLPGGSHSVTVTGSFAAGCKNPGDLFSSVSALVSDTPPNISVSVNGNSQHGVSGEAFLATTYDFTVTAGTGSGLFWPCVAAFSDRGSASAEVDGSTASGNSVNCPNSPTYAKPFTYGVPQSLTLELDAIMDPSLFGGEVRAGLGDSNFFVPPFEFWDADGNKLSNVTFTLMEEVVPTPEPATIVPGATVLAALGWLRRRTELGRVKIVQRNSTRSSR